MVKQPSSNFPAFFDTFSLISIKQNFVLYKLIFIINNSVNSAEFVFFAHKQQNEIYDFINYSTD